MLVNGSYSSTRDPSTITMNALWRQLSSDKQMHFGLSLKSFPE